MRSRGAILIAVVLARGGVWTFLSKEVSREMTGSAEMTTRHGRTAPIHFDVEHAYLVYSD